MGPSCLQRSHLWLTARGFAPAVVFALLLSPGPAHSAGGEQGAREDSPFIAPSITRQLELIRLVRHDCGSCHGMTLAGGLGPPLNKAALADKPQAYLQGMILRGRPGSAMPGWQGLVSEIEARWIALQLKEGFPDER